MEILKLENISRSYQKGNKQVNALKGVDLSINKGEFLTIVGPSGSGKTTLLNIIGCLDTPSSGTVVYNGQELGQMNEAALSDYRKTNIAFIFQSYNLIPVLTVRENVELPLVIEKQLIKEDMAKKALAIIEIVGLKGMADRRPAELSGGQEQRVAIARALVKSPLVVLADEPTANLDSTTAQDIMSVMETLNHEQGMTFIFSTHDKMVEDRAHRVINLKDGRIESDQRKDSL